MKCSKCGHRKSKVLKTIEEGEIVWRWRVCLECQKKWWTSEIEDEPLVKLYAIKGKK